MNTADLPELDIDTLTADDAVSVLSLARDRSLAARSIRGIELLSYDACAAVLLHDDFGPAIRQIMQMMGIDTTSLSGPGRNLLLSEGDDHVELRRVVPKWLTPRP